MQIPLLHGLVVSLSFGAIIGLIRQWSDQQSNHSDEPSAGLRTYSLWSLFGFLAAYISDVQTPYFFSGAFIIFGCILISDKNDHSSTQANSRIGLTSHAIALITFLCGGLVYWQEFEMVSIVTAAIVLLIASKGWIHDTTRKLTPKDISSILQFLAVTGLILPLVPNQGYGPFEALNPYKIWLMVVLISGLGFVGYIAMRFIGTQSGIVITGIVGGLASSTATTIALTRNSKSTPELSRTLAIGIVIANTIMIARISIIILILNQSLFNHIALPFLLMMCPAIVFAAFQFLKRNARPEPIQLPTISNPLGLLTAIQFGILYAIIAFLIKSTTELGLSDGFYPLAFVSGLTSMDAIALTLTHSFSDGSIIAMLATKGIILGAIANTAFKTIFAISLGDRALIRPILVTMFPMIIIGIGSLVIL